MLATQTHRLSSSKVSIGPAAQLCDVQVAIQLCPMFRSRHHRHNTQAESKALPLYADTKPC